MVNDKYPCVLPTGLTVMTQCSLVSHKAAWHLQSLLYLKGFKCCSLFKGELVNDFDRGLFILIRKACVRKRKIYPLRYGFGYEINI